MRNKTILILSLIFFLLVNTTYYWDRLLPGLWDMIFSGLFLLIFITLLIVLIIQIIKLLRKRPIVRSRILNICVLAIIIILTIVFPRGIIDFDKLEGQNLILARYEGPGNCTSFLEIKENDRFHHLSICLGVDEHKGSYIICSDTILFNYDNKSKMGTTKAYGLITLDTNNVEGKFGYLLFYKDSIDDNPLPMTILEYRIKN